MEASSSRSRGRSGSATLKRHRGVGTGSGSTAQSLNDDTLRSVFSRLDDHFDLARCCAVCNSWNRIIKTAHIMKDLYYKRNPQARGSCSDISMKNYFEELAMDDHVSALSRGSSEVYQWIGHPMRATLCRMKSGSILTGVGDKYCGDLGLIHGHAVGRDHVPKVGHGRLPKRTLGSLQRQLVGAQHLHHLLDVLEMLCPRTAKHQDIIKKHKNKFPNEGLEDLIHHGLERGWRIGEAEWHHQKFEEAAMRAERGLGYVVRMHADLMIPAAQVELGEETSAAEFIQKLVDHRNRILRLWSAESCKFMNEYTVPNAKTLVDFDFDENKIVGLTSSQLCIWRRSEPRSIFQSGGASWNHGLCMSYADPEVVIGCEDGRAFVYDMYSRSCSRIFRLHSSPVTCLTITDDLIVGGSRFGDIAIADHNSGQKLGVLKSAFAPLEIRCLCFSTNSQLIFAGSSAGYVHCWDLRTLRPLWEERVSPNVIYSAHHLPGDMATLAVGGIDGVLRLVCQRTGDTIRRLVVDADHQAESTSRSRNQIEKKRVRKVDPDARLDNIPRRLRPQITSLSVGMKKIVTTHGESYIRVWKFSPKSS